MILFGGALVDSLLAPLQWIDVAIVAVILLVVRPVTRLLEPVSPPFGRTALCSGDRCGTVSNISASKSASMRTWPQRVVPRRSVSEHWKLWSVATHRVSSCTVSSLGIRYPSPEGQRRVEQLDLPKARFPKQNFVV